MAVGLAIAAVLVSMLAAFAWARVSYQVVGGGFRGSRSLLTDLATLLAALRSIAVKGAIAIGDQRARPIPIDVELEIVRSASKEARVDLQSVCTLERLDRLQIRMIHAQAHGVFCSHMLRNLGQ